MSRFMISVAEVNNASAELENIVQSLHKLEGRLSMSTWLKDRSSISGDVTRIKGKVSKCERELADERNRISALKERLNTIAGLYATAEKLAGFGYVGDVSTVLDNVVQSLGMVGGEIATSTGNWIEQIIQILDNPNDVFDIIPEVGENIDWMHLSGPLTCILFGKGMDEDSVVSKYWDVLSDYIGGKTEKYFGNVTQADNAAEVVVDWYDFLMDDVYGDFDTMFSIWQNLEEERTFKKPELQGGLSDFFDALSDGGILIDAAKEIKSAYETGDWGEAYKNIGFDVFGKIVKEGNKYLDKIDNLKYLGWEKQTQSVLLNTMISMPQNWLEEVENYAKTGDGSAGTIVTEVVVGSFVENVANAAKPVYTVTTAITYPVVDELCEWFGYDLSGEYERLTGETGLKAIFAAQKELWVDIVYEEGKEFVAGVIDKAYDFAGDAGTWIADTAQDVGNWIADTAQDVSNWVADTAQDVGSWVADTAKQGWNNFKSGFCRFFGG